MKARRAAVWLLLLTLVAGCSTRLTPPELAPEASPAPKPRLLADRFDNLPGWQQDSHAALLPALRRSCALWLKRPPTRPLALPDGQNRSVAAMQAACGALPDLPEGSAGDQAMRRYLERHFQPYAVLDSEEASGLFTGYFEPLLTGSRQRLSAGQVPLYAPPPDLVSVDLGRFRDDLRGERIAGRVENGRLVPYEDRAAIEAGALAGHGLELLYVDDPVAAFFLQIQGSGVVHLDSGERVRVGYAAQNGHPYFAIGRSLIARGALTRETVSMQRIADWLRVNPAEAEEVMQENPSFVFFALRQGPGPLGAEGTALTPGRSLAVDRRFWPLGLPFWLDVEDPRAGAGRLRRSVVAQDIGGAIRGVVRGDLFWGHGAAAEQAAGAMRSTGRYWILLPRRPADIAGS